MYMTEKRKTKRKRTQEGIENALTFTKGITIQVWESPKG